MKKRCVKCEEEADDWHRAELHWCVRCLGEAELRVLLFARKTELLPDVQMPPHRRVPHEDLKPLLKTAWWLVIKMGGCDVPMRALMSKLQMPRFAGDEVAAMMRVTIWFAM